MGIYFSSKCRFVDFHVKNFLTLCRKFPSSLLFLSFLSASNVSITFILQCSFITEIRIYDTSSRSR